jgi:hypothetical protein
MNEIVLNDIVSMPFGVPLPSRIEVFDEESRSNQAMRKEGHRDLDE